VVQCTEHGPCSVGCWKHPAAFLQTTQLLTATVEITAGTGSFCKYPAAFLQIQTNLPVTSKVKEW
jgi:hypothetical protein